MYSLSVPLVAQVFSAHNAPKLLPYGLGDDHAAVGSASFEGQELCVKAQVDETFLRTGGCLASDGTTYFSGNFEHHIEGSTAYSGSAKTMFPKSDQIHFGVDVKDLSSTAASIFKLVANFVTETLPKTASGEELSRHRNRLMAYKEDLFGNGYDGAELVSDLTYGMAGEDIKISGSVNGTFQGPTRATTVQLAIPNFRVENGEKPKLKALAEFGFDSADNAVEASLSADCNPPDGEAPGVPGTWQKQDCSVIFSVSDKGVQQLHVVSQVGWANSAMNVGEFKMSTQMTYKDGTEQKTVAAEVPSLKWTYGDVKGALSMDATLATKEDLYGFALTAVEWDRVADRLTYTGKIDPGQNEKNKIDLVGDFQWFGSVEDGFRSGNCAVETTSSKRHCVNVGYRNDVVAGQAEKSILELSLHLAVAEMDETMSLIGNCDDSAEHCNGRLTMGSAASVNIKHISTDKIVMDVTMGNVPGQVGRSRRGEDGEAKQWTYISLDCDSTCEATVASGKEGSENTDFKLVVGDTRRVGVDDDTLYINFKVTNDK